MYVYVFKDVLIKDWKILSNFGQKKKIFTQDVVESSGKK